jgi:glutaredoxin 2
MKVGIPALQKLCVMFLDEPLDPVEFLSAEAVTVLQTHRDKPEFGNLLVTLDMHVGWLITVPRIEKEAVRTNTQDSRHNTVLSFRWERCILARCDTP